MSLPTDLNETRPRDILSTMSTPKRVTTKSGAVIETKSSQVFSPRALVRTANTAPPSLASESWAFARNHHSAPSKIPWSALCHQNRPLGHDLSRHCRSITRTRIPLLSTHTHFSHFAYSSRISRGCLVLRRTRRVHLNNRRAARLRTLTRDTSSTTGPQSVPSPFR